MSSPLALPQRLITALASPRRPDDFFALFDPLWARETLRARIVGVQPGDATSVRARHILVETEDEAKAIIAELDKGADFETLAKEKSTGPSGPAGGDLGYFSRGRMVPEFEEAAFALDVGAYTEEPVQTQFGWHVIQLNETRIKEAPTLEEVRDELRAKVEQDVVKAHIDGLVENANVDRSGSEAIDPKLLSNMDLTE